MSLAYIHLNIALVPTTLDCVCEKKMKSEQPLVKMYRQTFG